MVRIPAERELALGPLLVRYSNPVADRAQVLLDLLPRVSAFVAKANGGRPPTEQFTVNILASGGGGWSGGKEIGVQCGGPVAANVAVIAHELTHSWTGPLPGILGEGWASMVGMRAAGALGFAKEADDERRMWAAQLTAFEKDGQQLDITLADRDRRLFGASEAKLMAMIEQLEGEHGADFMPRFLELCLALKGLRDANAPRGAVLLLARCGGRSGSGPTAIGDHGATSAADTARGTATETRRLSRREAG